jgi:aminoglycoside 3-N-acetyltransferase
MEHKKGLLSELKRRIKLVLRMKRNRRLTGPEIVEDLRRLGVAAGDILMVHSSLSSLGFVPGGASTVIDALLAAVGPEGTLVLPTHSWEIMERGCRTFDVRNTPSCVGAMTERFRKMPGARRSLHPTHSVAAIGPRAEELIGKHEYALTPCGAGSPYAKLLLAGGRVLFIGVGLESNTAYHTIEAMASVPYLLMAEPDVFTVIDEQGHSRRLSIRRHKARIPRCFEGLEGELIDGGIVRPGLIGKTRSLLLDGMPFMKEMSAILQQSPDYLLQAGHSPAASSISPASE